MAQERRFLTNEQKEDYKAWHEKAYKEDIEIYETLQEKNDRWTIIIGYYSMHNITKLFLAKKRNIYLFGEHVHDQCIEMLEDYCSREKKELNQLIDALKKAKKVSESYLRAQNIHSVLSYAKRERSKANYYSERNHAEVKEFIEQTVEPYIKIIKNLLEEC